MGQAVSELRRQSCRRNIAAFNAEKAEQAKQRYRRLLSLDDRGYKLSKIAEIEGTTYHATRVAMRTARIRAKANLL